MLEMSMASQTLTDMTLEMLAISELEESQEPKPLQWVLLFSKRNLVMSFSSISFRQLVCNRLKVFLLSFNFLTYSPMWYMFLILTDLMLREKETSR